MADIEQIWNRCLNYVNSTRYVALVIMTAQPKSYVIYAADSKVPPDDISDQLITLLLALLLPKTAVDATCHKLKGSAL